MKQREFKTFSHWVEMAHKDSPIWYLGCYWCDMTPRQHKIISNILSTKGFINVRHDPAKGVSWYVLPNGLEVKVAE